MERKEEILRRERERAREIFRVTWLGFWVNVFLSIFKISAGYIGNSRAVLADGVHSLSDLITDIAVLVGVRFWIAPPDERHPYGYKRLESLISFFIGALLAVAGLGIAYDAISRIGSQGNEQVGSIFALVAALSSIVSKEILFRWTVRKAKELKSDAVEANAWDHRSDAISSIPTALAVAVAVWFPDFAVVDLIGALLVSLFILHAAWSICRSAAHVLVDGGVDERIGERIADYCMRLDAVRGVHDLRTRYLGQALQVDMHVCVDADLTVEQGNDIAHNVERALYSPEAVQYIGVEIFDALVHIDPWRPQEKGDIL
ncbi:cation diffusion facilitator family transporter [Desulfovibrio sp. OttesenSCG-928-A18]|nr:cation diffusion facilitator family transporter [Desulfovibrio sp. OttesenSCG-928-A18]